MGGPAPLTLAEFGAAVDRIGGFERRPLIALAVSGGPDSMALALLADRWARERGGAVRAITVDHRLRPESAAEAPQVAQWLGARGIPHETLVWDGDKPAAGIQQAARAARYRLLAEWCAAQGILHLMTAHQREDQAETYAIRQRAGSGLDGLAGMAAVRELPGCRVLRPLLDISHARLVALLAVEGQPFLDDPSNRNPAFERARLRSGEAALGEPAIEAAVAQARRCAAVRIERETALAALLARAVALHPAGIAAIEVAAFRAAPAELAERLLARVATCIGGLEHPPRRERVVRLRAALAEARGRGRTLGGCRFVFWRGRILVFREAAAAEPPVQLDRRDRLVWDRRFDVRLRSTAAGPVTLGYAAQLRERRDGGDRRGALPRLLRSVLPEVADGPAEAANFALLFRPANPLTHAGFAVV